MWLSIVIACGWLDGKEYCESTTPLAFFEEGLCRTHIVRAALDQLKAAEEIQFDVSGAFADCQLVEIESDVF